MSYSIYTTQAIVLRVIPSGEANCDVVLFTRTLGKITARVQSGRKSESKMRMFITRFRMVTVDLVRGKAIWRLTGITGEPLTPLVLTEATLKPVHRVLRLAEFLIQGEGAHPELFDFFETMITAKLESSQLPFQKTVQGFEIYSVIKLLEHLGYWHGEALATEITGALLEYCALQKTELVKKINESISATQIVV